MIDQSGNAPSKVGATSSPNAKRGDLVESYKQTRKLKNEFIKRLVVDEGRLDVLCREVLGYDVYPHHQAIIDYQDAHHKSQVLAFRGAGKSTVGNVARCIHLILKNPNIRILIGSKTSMNAHDFLREIKTHFEQNEKLHEVFGNYVGNSRWSDQAIEVRHRTIAAKEPTINTLGVESSIVSKHYDVIIGDDLVDEENSRTPGQRERTVNWFYTTLLPCLEPPDPRNSDVGRLFMLGTRYHPGDLYGHLEKRDMRGSMAIVPMEREDGRSNWPDRYTEKHIAELKRNMGLARFMLQYQCSTAGLKGSIFEYEWMRWFEAMPLGLRIFIGVDPAISQKESADHFALAVIGVDVMNDIYVLDGVKGHFPFHKQIELIGKYCKIYNPIETGVEANAYQLAMVQELARQLPGIRFEPVYTTKDKVTRARCQSPYFESGRVYFNNRTSWVVEDLLAFPDSGKDTFDALDIAMKRAMDQIELRDDDDEPGLFYIGSR